jgi:hypothetical protein
MLNEHYMVTNELIESQWPRDQLNNSLTYMLRPRDQVNNSLTYMLEKTNINPTKKLK